ncbi:MAG: ABC transporter ATP-binding protein [Ruminococcus flavefaciens]|nr:ABC transporter ATP-binding protein [Ruminococcus flavefaciens]
MNLLTISNIHKAYKKHVAVENVSFEIEKGDIYGILGPNGAGKSTTINTIVGFLKHDSGNIVFEDKYSIKEWRKNIGYVPQELAIYLDLTAEENVRFFCALYGFKGNELEKRTRLALEFTGLQNESGKKASEFSGGMKRRLNIATAIAHTPKLVIMDEPTVGIDPQSRNHILESIKRLNAEGTTVLYTTHYMEEVEEICNKIIIIDHGKVVANGYKSDVKSVVVQMKIITVEMFEKSDAEKAAEKLKSESAIEKIELNGNVVTCTCRQNDFIVQNVISAVTSAGVKIKNINCEMPSLEDVFLSVTGKELRD